MRDERENLMESIRAECDQISAMTRLLAFACAADNRAHLEDADITAIIETARYVSDCADRVADDADRIRAAQKVK